MTVKHHLASNDPRQRHPLYARWVTIRQRCRNPRHERFKDYGGRVTELCPEGIYVDPVWDDFAQFVADVGPCPGEGYSIDRVDNDGPYAPWNVRWATRAGQRANRYRTPWPFGVLVKDAEREEEEQARVRAEAEGWDDNQEWTPAPAGGW